MSAREFYVPDVSCGFCSVTGTKVHSNEKCSVRSGMPHTKLSPPVTKELVDSGKELCLLCWVHEPERARMQNVFEADLAIGTAIWNPLAQSATPIITWIAPVSGYVELPDVEMVHT